MAKGLLRVAAAIGGGVLQAAGNARLEEIKSARAEKLQKLEQEWRSTESRLDREHRDRLEGERQFAQLGSDTLRIKSQEKSDDLRETGAERRHKESLGSAERIAEANRTTDTTRTNTSQAELIEEPDGSLTWSYPDGTSKPAMKGDKPLKGRRSGLTPSVTAPSGFSAQAMNAIKVAETQEGLDEYADPEERSAAVARVATRLRNAGLKTHADRYEALGGKLEEPTDNGAAPPPPDPTTATAGEPKPAPQQTPKPPEYPDARWSDDPRATGWVVFRDGKWQLVE